ncbi:MAG: EF-P lysine aminoacylase GenX [Rhodospirillaceae bacterium]|nr:EF-P lysine aminoacylase GenX [Rhodospirillaceae bacterium]
MQNNETPSDKSSTPTQWWRPDVFEERADTLVRRADMLKGLRDFFDRRGYVEVDTPALQVSPGMEPQLTAFETTLSTLGGDRQAVYLHTSPEFAMKKLLVAGMQRIFQLAHVFRDRERSAQHHPEFTMLEWYCAGASWRDLAEEAVDLVRASCGPVVRRGEVSCDLTQPWEYLSVQDAFGRYTSIDLLETAKEPLHPDTEMLRMQADGLGIRTVESDTWEDIFFRIYLERIEAKLGVGVATVLHSYPACMAALARISPDDARVSERFEIFICGLELANGYGELTDAAEQRRRFAVMADQRLAEGRPPYPIDEEFIAALESGLPECAGIALGFDRLVMLAAGAGQIDDVLWAPVVDPGARVDG